MASQPNVVVVVADTTRVDDAYDAAVAPTLADLADSGTRATRAFSAAPWTLPSHASMLTGTHTSRHGAHAGHERLDGDLPVLPECFRAAGYDTVCVSSNTWLSVESGFGQGFGEFEQTWQAVQSENALSELVDETEERRLRAVGRRLFDGNPVANAANVLYRLLVRGRSDDGAARATSFVEDLLAGRDGDDPFFLFANYLEPHLEYRPPRRLAEEFLPPTASYEAAMDVPQEPWAYLAGGVSLSESDLAMLRGLYRAEIAYVDEQLAALREALRAAGELANTVFVVTADHGENIGDHGLMDHQYCLYDSLVHVPLVFSGGSFEGGGDLTELVSLVDLAPTLLDAAGIDAPAARESFQGVSVHPDADTEPREFVVSEYAEPQPSMAALERNLGRVPDDLRVHDRSLRAVRTDAHKLVWGSDGSRALYDLDADPGETTDVAVDRPAVVDDLTATLDDWLASFEHADADGPVTISGDRKDRLEQLGYLQ
ncbi:sulfatase [Halobacterium jilantaiense]|uniref:Arylsulfatase A n=1 Tax=Halobacterium jilantaiense TaxID=355548 RepID=A0A1I0P960_9EURY|nr:sulfatase [Halobacterium jilantaiense]SEW10748.1 Arylsulfatase A [Halobacterium jilantaiense]